MLDPGARLQQIFSNLTETAAMSGVVTRFAPSPTGFLHIGGARTALFNWLFARHSDGRMLLRIEDTDRARSTEPAIAAILDGLTWLGLDWDGEPVSQYARMVRHREIVETLLTGGNAYRCYCTPEELEAMRARALAEGRSLRYEGTWRDRDPADAPTGRPFAIRFRAPDSGETVIDDLVQGRIVVQNKDLDDLIILRSDGSPTYNLSVVVDDHDMGVTHVIRGVDHLTNAARQIHVYQALGWPIPEMAHIPLIHGPDGAKLSKRHGALGVEAYRAMGYLPQALRTYLARLGWSHGDQEIFSTEELIDLFSLEHVGRSPARFDFAKLESVNGHFIRHIPECELLQAFIAFLPYAEGGKDLLKRLEGDRKAQIEKALPALRTRAKTLVELQAAAGFIFAERPLDLDERARKVLDEEARARLAALLPELAASPEWSAAALEDTVKAFAERQALKLGAIAQPLRASLTGTLVSPGIFDVLEALGRDESLARIGDQTG
jgi:glutamyl-tRNA synthetase